MKDEEDFVFDVPDDSFEDAYFVNHRFRVIRGSEEDGRRIMNASDGEAVRIDNPEKNP